MYAVKDDVKKALFLKIIDEFEERVLIVRDELEKGMIHGDFNEQNVIVKKFRGIWQVTALLDFGDSHYSCYLFELAITITYMIILAKNMDVAGYVLSGYETERQIPEKEFALLKVSCFLFIFRNNFNISSDIERRNAFNANNRTSHKGKNIKFFFFFFFR